MARDIKTGEQRACSGHAEPKISDERVPVDLPGRSSDESAQCSFIVDEEKHFEITQMLP